MNNLMKHTLRAMVIFILWGIIGLIGIILSTVYNLYVGGLFVSICYLIWLEFEKWIEKWWISLE